jgi:sialidase-1
MDRWIAATTSLILALLILVSGHVLAGKKLEPPTENVLFESGKEGYHTYRIPALAVTSKGTLLAICEGRKTSSSDHGDVDLVLKRSTDGGTTWSALALLHEEGQDAQITIGNPCVVVDQIRGQVQLLFTRNNDKVFVTSSSDEGQTWSKPRDITASVKQPDWTWYATGPGNGIQLIKGTHKGRLVIPCDHRVKDIKNKKQSSRSHVVYSDDHGQTWQIGGVTDTHMNECAVAELADGTLLLNMRSFRGKSQRGIALSKDGGLTWSPVQDDAVLVEPVCQASLLRYSWENGKEKSILAFANPADPKARKNMTVRLSLDEGRTWPISKAIWKGSAIYSSLARLPDGNLGLLYERESYRQIVFCRISLAWLTQG